MLALHHLRPHIRNPAPHGHQCLILACMRVPAPPCTHTPAPVSRITVKEKWYTKGLLDETAFLHSMNSYWAMLQYYRLQGLRRTILQKKYPS